jgi:hypothetical protein
MRRRLSLQPEHPAVTRTHALLEMQDALCAALKDVNTPGLIAELFGCSDRRIRDILQAHFVIGREYVKPGKTHIIPRVTAERIIREHLCRT